ncbi:uncharacterized protein F5891DRAFT_1021798, partial [Suillus fuscotomentosus]
MMMILFLSCNSASVAVPSSNDQCNRYPLQYRSFYPVPCDGSFCRHTAGAYISPSRDSLKCLDLPRNLIALCCITEARSQINGYMIRPGPTAQSYSSML